MRAKLRELALCLGIIFEETVLVLGIEFHKLFKLRILNQASVTLCGRGEIEKGEEGAHQVVTDLHPESDSIN